jgi:chromosome segregation ATPase
MANQDVEEILEEIRERVRAGEQGRPQPSERERDSPSVLTETERSPQLTVLLKNSYSGLTVMARAWDRLPPLVSNRTGNTARLELWLKARLKRLTRWFTWEQVNFNAASHQTLRDLVESLSNYEQYLDRLQVQIADRLDGQQAELNAQRTELSVQKGELEAQRAAFNVELKAQRAELIAQRAALNAQQIELGRQQAELRSDVAQKYELIENLKADLELDLTKIRNDLSAADAQRRELQAQLAAMATELRVRDETLLDEQRVCFRQLSLEASESFVLQDRARREIESRLAKLENKKG